VRFTTAESLTEKRAADLIRQRITEGAWCSRLDSISIRNVLGQWSATMVIATAGHLVESCITSLIRSRFVESAWCESVQDISVRDVIAVPSRAREAEAVG